MQHLNKKKLIFSYLILISFLSGYSFLLKGAEVSFTLKNQVNFNRVNELAEVEIKEVSDFSSLSLHDATDTPLPYEILGGGKIRFQANIPAGGTATYTLKNGTPLTPETKTYAVQKEPNNRNDIAWENDISIYRMYSKLLLSTEPQTANGVDIWYKKKSYPVIDILYTYNDYHTEGEEGVDAHSVNGKTLGGGGIGAYVNDRLWLHDPYDVCEIIENGPLRSEFVLTYNNVNIDGDSYTKTLRIITSANGLLNKAIVKLEGKEKPMQLAAGIFLHTNMGYDPNGLQYTSESNLAGYAENKSEGTVTSAGARMYAGIYMPGEVITDTIDHHLILRRDYTVGTELIYYFGGGWNIFPVEKYITDEDWFDALYQFKQSVLHPLTETSMEVLPKKSEVVELIHFANRYWQERNATHGNSFWNRAAYHTGNMEAYSVTGEAEYLEFSEAWSVQNEWKGAKSDDKSKWKYTYGESDEYVLFGDWQICFQVYADLYNINPADYKIARAREVMEYQMSTPQNDYWWWVDGLYMVMPVMTKLYNITGNALYLEKLHEYWTYANNLMYDEEEGLYYRDAKYIYPDHKTTSGKKDFWARGDGWAFAALAKILGDLPENAPYREEYRQRYLRMAQAIAACQQEEGYWSRSLLDPDYAAGYETSGTAFFTYGFLWGINNGYLQDKDYGKTVEKAWNYLTTIALQESGKVGYVQPIGESATQHDVNAETTADFGVGAFLLAASEMARFAVGEMPEQYTRLYAVTAEDALTVKAVFNRVLDPVSASDINNYTVNGNIIDGSVVFDGNRTVTITLSKALDYGRHTLEVENLISIDNEKIETDARKIFVFTVPLTAGESGITVSASGYQSGNPPANTIDNSLGTRWSQAGLNQWIKYDLGREEEVWAVDIAFYAGTNRISYFDIELSTDNVNFTKVLPDMETSGLTDEMERYTFPAQQARYVRIVCNGNSEGGENWNSITELRIRYIDPALEDASLPSEIYTDILLPLGGASWSSSNPSLLSAGGYVNLPDTPTPVTLTARYGEQEKTFEVTVMPRTIEKNKVVYYAFDVPDLYTDNGNAYVKDKSGKGNDARVYGKAEINGRLDLTANTAAGFSTNGYLMAPEGLIDSLRSFSVFVKVNPQSIANLPRIFDFGSSSGNSVFGRADAPTFGFKYNGGTTVLINSPTKLQTNRDTYLTFTFDAQSKTSRIYMDGVLTIEETSIAYEPYQLSLIAKNTRNYIGRTQWWDVSGEASKNVDFRGTMDNFYLFDIALTKEEINYLQENEPTGIADLKQNNSFSLYPNPVKQNENIYLYFSDITTENYQIEVINTQGITICSASGQVSPLLIGKISQPGFYLVKITGNDRKNITLKLVID